MNLGTALVSLLLIVMVVAIIRSIAKDKRAGKNVGCGSCKSCAHATTSFRSFKKTSHAASGSCPSCPSCAHIDAMLADLDQSVGSSAAIPSKSSQDLPSSACVKLRSL